MSYIYKDRSIPAYAGEPVSAEITALRPRVYPRVCGGTAAGGWDTLAPAGLSPRMRGNQSGAPTPAETPRSIPAYAGEPV